MADPAAFVGPEDKTCWCFRRVDGYLQNRIEIVTSLPLASLDRLTLHERPHDIGRT